MTNENAAALPQPNYKLIFGTLLALTLVTVAISRLDLGMAGNMALAIIVASIKALLVAAYFMHLKFERWMLVAVVAAPLFFTVVLILGLLPDICFR
jgi:cytochrome c oxidase subunit IV